MWRASVEMGVVSAIELEGVGKISMLSAFLVETRLELLWTF
jgi:hypothetical protein